MLNRAREFNKIGIGIGRSICSERPREDKSRELIPHIGPTPIIIPLKIFLNLLLDPLFPRELSDSQSYVLNFTYFDSWAKSHAMLHDVREVQKQFWRKGKLHKKQFIHAN